MSLPLKTFMLPAFVGFTAFYSVVADAAGGSAANGGGTGGNVGVQALPTRPVQIQPVLTHAFRLPNGKPVDLTADLNRMFETVVAKSKFFMPFDPSEDFDASCGRTLKMEANINTLDLNVGSAGIRFGYADNSIIDSPVTVDGKLKVSIGRISMAFRTLECNKEGCRVPLGAIESHLTTDVELNFDVDFGDVNGGGDFLFKTPLGKILQKIMEQGIRSMEADFDKLHRLTWRATVRSVDRANGLIVFDAGSRDGLRANEIFEVYSARGDARSACQPFAALAMVKTQTVNTLSSIAQIESVLDSEEIQVGDIVTVRYLRR